MKIYRLTYRTQYSGPTTKVYYSVTAMKLAVTNLRDYTPNGIVTILSIEVAEVGPWVSVKAVDTIGVGDV